MKPHRILRETIAGETREVLLDGSGRAFALRIDRWSERGKRLRLGERHDARIRSLDPSQGGAFVEIVGKGEAFLRLTENRKLTEGAALRVRVVSEARGGKLPRVAPVPPEGPDEGAERDDPAEFEEVPPGHAEVAAAFDEALAPAVQIEGGGYLRIERTSALTAVDIDSAGRTGKGNAGSRAFAINRAACLELARQVSLRKLGGLIVLDCLAPLNGESGRKLQKVLKDALSEAGISGAAVLAPSRFGLMEMSLPWRETPLAERLLDSDRRPTPETLCLAGIRQLEAEASADRLRRFRLVLPEAAHQWFMSDGGDVRSALAGKYGARFAYEASTCASPIVYRAE